VLESSDEPDISRRTDGADELLDAERPGSYKRCSINQGCQTPRDHANGHRAMDTCGVAYARSSPIELSFYCTALIMSKIGRYIATTMPPTITPRNTIMTGSIRLSSPLTAVSTSVS